MDFEVFTRLVEKRKREKPALFELEHDKILSIEEIALQEKSNHISIPEKYRLFLLRYGGGYFGFVNAYSLDSESCFFIPDHMDDVPEGYIPISDNGCGDLFLLKMEYGGLQEQVYFLDHETKDIQATRYADVFAYLLEAGLSVALQA